MFKKNQKKFLAFFTPSRAEGLPACLAGITGRPACLALLGIAGLLFCFFVFLPAIVSAAETTVVNLPNPLGEGNTDPRVIIGYVIKAALGVTGSLALAIFVYGGIIWMLAGGNQERVKKGREILMWATIGLAVVFSSYAIVNWIIDALQNAS